MLNKIKAINVTNTDAILEKTYPDWLPLTFLIKFNQNNAVITFSPYNFSNGELLANDKGNKNLIIDDFSSFIGSRKTLSNLILALSDEFEKIVNEIEVSDDISEIEKQLKNKPTDITLSNKLNAKKVALKNIQDRYIA